jgi:hypothetical protein
MSDKAVINDVGTGLTLYIVERNGIGQAWNGSAFATETTTRSTFAIAAAEIGTTGHYTATIPGTAGFRRRTWYKQLGGSPATTDTALGIEEGYWDGTTLDAVSGVTNFTAANVTILPVASTVSAGEVSDGSITVYQFAAFGPFTFTIIDDDENAVVLTGKSISFVVYDLKGTWLWQIDNCGVSGTGHNIVTVSGGDTHTQSIYTARYVLRDTTDDTVLARGSLKVERDADAH